MAKIRLDKYLAEMGIGTRTQVKEMIRKQLVLVNGEVVRSPETKVDTDTDQVICQGKTVTFAEYVYYMLNKPEGVVSATTDPRERTVIDLITGTKRKDLFPVGRLDKDTVGLLLITNDGALANQLLAPKKHVDKVYEARVRGFVTEEEIHKFSEGVDIGDDTLTKPAELVILEAGEESRIQLTITEGRYHQVKRMFQAVGMEVLWLKRLSMGSLVLDEGLASGAFRELTEEELISLKNK